MNELVSICIPAYNQTEFLRRTLASIAEQDYPHFEVILSDDSGTDIVQQLAAEYAGKIPSLTYHRNIPSLGSPANWNRCMDLASGAIIKFMHHDDWFSSSRSLSTFVSGLQNGSLAFSISEIVDVSEERIRLNDPPDNFVESVRTDPRNLFNDNRIGSPSATIFRKTDLRFDTRLKYLVDIDFYIRYLEDRKLVFIPKALIVNTAGHPGQVTSQSLSPEVQLGEYHYLYDKVFKGKIEWRLSRFFVDLYRKYDVRSFAGLKRLVTTAPRPALYFRLLILLSKL